MAGFIEGIGVQETLPETAESGYFPAHRVDGFGDFENLKPETGGRQKIQI